MSEARRMRVVEFIEEYHDGCWNLQTETSDGLAERVAENVMAYHDIKPRSFAEYVTAVREAFLYGELVKRTSYGPDSMSLMVCTRDFIEGLSD